MCWSAEVSKAFATLDLLFIGVLLWKAYSVREGKLGSLRNPVPPTFYGTYASFLSAIAVQEWAQFAAWKWGSLRKYEDFTQPAVCTGRDMFVSFLATGSALLIPVVFMVSAYITITTAPQQGVNTTSSEIRPIMQFSESSGEERMSSTFSHASPSSSSFVSVSHVYSLLRKAAVAWLAGVVIIVACVVHTQTYCIELGQRHHQVWICASAVYRTGGYPLYFLMLLFYLASALYSLFALPSIPTSQRQWIYAIGLTNAAVAFGMYCWTLEACSIWCWSAFTYGIYFTYLCLYQ